MEKSVNLQLGWIFESEGLYRSIISLGLTLLTKVLIADYRMLMAESCWSCKELSPECCIYTNVYMCKQTPIL